MAVVIIQRKYHHIRVYRTESWFAPSQWETSLQSNPVSHWLGANPESAVISFIHLELLYGKLHLITAYTSWFMWVLVWHFGAKRRWPQSYRWHFQINAVERRCCILCKSHWNLSPWDQLIVYHIGQENGLVPIRRRAIIWAKVYGRRKKKGVRWGIILFKYLQNASKFYIFLQHLIKGP